MSHYEHISATIRRHYYDIANSELVLYTDGQLRLSGSHFHLLEAWKCQEARRDSRVIALSFSSVAVFAHRSASFGNHSVCNSQTRTSYYLHVTHINCCVFLECRNWSGFHQNSAGLINSNSWFWRDQFRIPVLISCFSITNYIIITYIIILYYNNCYYFIRILFLKSPHIFVKITREKRYLLS